MRTLLADDNGGVRAALRLLFEEMGQPDVVEAADVAQIQAAMKRERIDVVLLDWELPDAGQSCGDRGEFVAELKLTAPGCRVIAMSGRPEAREESLGAGCDGFVSRNDPPDFLLALAVG